MAARKEEDLCPLPNFALEVFGRDLYPGLQPHATICDHRSWLHFSLSSLKAGIRTIAIFHPFTTNLTIIYYYFLKKSLFEVVWDCGKLHFH